MASTQPFAHVRLSSEDVPGAKFKHADISQHTIMELKRWLECRNLPVSGNKEELVRRCEACVESGKSMDICITIDRGKWYEKKMSQILADALKAQKNSIVNSTTQVPAPCPPTLPITGWKEFPSQAIPNPFSYGDIYQYLVESATFVSDIAAVTDKSDNDDSPNTYNVSKSLKRGRTYFVSGHVQNIRDCTKHGHYFVKAQVLSSFHTDVFYNVHVTINVESGSIVDGSCECKASAMGRCSHVSGVLLALEDYVIHFGNQPVSSTSKMCEWNKGRKKGKRPMSVQTHQYSKRNRTDFIIQHDPRPLSNQTDLFNTEFKNNFIKSLPDKTMWGSILNIEYKDYTLSAEEISILCQKCEQLLKNLTPEGSDPVEIEGTAGQAKSTKWIQERSWRVTASRCKEVCNCATEKARTRIVNEILWNHKNVKSVAMSYGNFHEKDAFDQYAEKRQNACSVRMTGLWVNPRYPQLACSPDGLVDEGNVMGLLEIKCPYIVRDIHPGDIENLTPKQKNCFCSSLTNGELKLKKSHAYYYQIQMQMAVCNLGWCDFVLWSKHGMCVERIHFDSAFWEDKLKKLIAFHGTYLAPEYFEMRVPRRLPLLNVKH